MGAIMNDLDIIKEIEKHIEIPLWKMPLDELTKNADKPIRGYTVDDAGRVIGLRLNNTIFRNSNLITRFNNLKVLILKYNFISEYKFLTSFPHLCSLYLTDSTLSDISFLTEFKELTTLGLSSDNISDFLVLKELKGLTTLDLRSNNISDISDLKELKGLTTLDLSSNNISDISDLNELKGLTILNLSSNKISNIFVLKELKRIKVLYLSSNIISHIFVLKELNELTTLDLSFNNTSNISDIKEIKGLTTLDLRSNNISDISDLKELKGLTTLSLSDNKQISDFSFLKELKGLTALYFSYNDISDISFLKELKGMTKLYLSDNNISDISFLNELKGLTTCNLSRNRISDFSGLKELKGLTWLYLSDNKQISDFSNLKELKGLSALYLSNNNISDISFLKEFKGLTTLDLRSNNISDISFLKELKELTTLYLSYNDISDIFFLNELKGMTALDLSENNISETSFLKELKGLNRLYLRSNKISNISFLKELKGLTILDLSDNKISDISFLNELKGLTNLYLGSNKISDISLIGDLPHLNYLSFDNNPIDRPPPEIAEQSLAAIRNYFKSIKITTKTDYLYEAKLLIVGAGAVGKTCLMNKLLEPGKEINLKEISTEGIDIREWILDTKKIKNFRINFWDFGGQEILHATHQFFLTKRSLYLFVWDSRMDEHLTSFDYWLNVLKLLSDNSPVICVLNKIDIDRPINIDENTLQEEFENIVSFHKVSALKNLGIETLIGTIKNEIIKLPHIGTELPKEWIDIRTDLENLKKNYINYSEYVEICRSNDLNDEQAAYLSEYYHDLGAFLHFKDNDILKDIVFLKSEWATDAVYLLVENKNIQVNNGVFTHLELKQKYWKGKYPEKMYSQLLELMKKFELCFQMDPQSESYVVPELLKLDKPEFDWSYKDNLRFEYFYKFMPAGILTRFMARNHQMIKYKIYWKNGVVLKSKDSENTQALIIGEKLNKKIKIWVCGEDKKEMLEFIRNDILQIHETLNNPNFKEMIPCVCSECKPNPEPFLWDFSILKKAFSKNKKSLPCNNSFEEIKIDSIINNLLTSMDKVKQFLSRNSIVMTEHAGIFAGALWRVYNK